MRANNTCKLVTISSVSDAKYNLGGIALPTVSSVTDIGIYPGHHLSSRPHVNSTRAMQPVATCRQSPYVHKPAIVKLLLLIYSFQFRFAFRERPRPAIHAHFRHRHISVTDTFLNSSVKLIVV